MTIAELLKRSALFADFTPVGLEIISRIAQPKIVLAGKPLFVEGTSAEALYVVIEGRVRVLVKSVDGSTDLAIGTLGPGDHVSEMALLAGKNPMPHLCSAVAEVDSKLLEISASGFQDLMKEKPQACIKLLLAAGQELAVKATEAREVLKAVVARGIAR